MMHAIEIINKYKQYYIAQAKTTGKSVNTILQYETIIESFYSFLIDYQDDHDMVGKLISIRNQII